MIYREQNRIEQNRTYDIENIENIENIEDEDIRKYKSVFGCEPKSTVYEIFH